MPGAHWVFVQYTPFIGFACAGVESAGRISKGRIVLYVRVDSRHFDIAYRFVRILSAGQKLEPPIEMVVHCVHGPIVNFLKEKNLGD